MEDDKRKWPKILGWTLYILFFSLVGFLGAYYNPEFFTELFTFTNLLLTFFIIIISFPLHIFLHEVGHVLGGLASGYDLIMFRMFNHMWLKTEKGVSYRKQFVPGMLGQALMAPPEKKDNGKVPFLLYHASGVIMNVITAVVFIFAAIDSSDELFAYVLYVSAGVALLLAVMNTIPKPPTDGYNIMIQLKSEEIQKELTNSLYMYRDMTMGAKFQYLQKYVDLEAIEKRSHPNAVTMSNVYAASFLEAFEFESAHEIYAELWNNLDELIDPIKADAIFNYLFTLALTNPESSEIQEVLKHPLVNQYINLKQADVLRVRATVALYVDSDLDLAESLLEEGDKLIPYTPTISEENLEKDLYQYLRKELVLQKHGKVTL